VSKQCLGDGVKSIPKKVYQLLFKIY